MCLTPVTLVRKDMYNVAGRYGTDVVPCGRCPACLRRRQFNWVFRLKEEQKVADSSAFLTLTYNNENIPIINGQETLQRKDHQKFIKRLRKQINTHFGKTTRQPLRYYACGEYGEISARPHYHSIIFNLPDEYIRNPELVTNAWGNGTTMVAECNQKTIAYTTKYMNKTMYTQKPDPNDKREKERSMVSKGLGVTYLTPNRVSYYKRKLEPYLTVQNGDKIPLPRYYKNKIFDKDDIQILQEKALAHIEANPQFIDEKHRHDVVKQEFHKHKFQNQLNRQKL